MFLRATGDSKSSCRPYCLNLRDAQDWDEYVNTSRASFPGDQPQWVSFGAIAPSRAAAVKDAYESGILGYCRHWMNAASEEQRSGIWMWYPSLETWKSRHGSRDTQEKGSGPWIATKNKPSGVCSNR